MRFLSLTAHGYVQPLTTEHCGSVHYITIGDGRLLTEAGLTRSPLYIIGDAASRCGLSRVGYFMPINGRRPLNGHPPSGNYDDVGGDGCGFGHGEVTAMVITMTIVVSHLARSDTPNIT